MLLNRLLKEGNVWFRVEIKLIDNSFSFYWFNSKFDIIIIIIIIIVITLFYNNNSSFFSNCDLEIHNKFSYDTKWMCFCIHSFRIQISNCRSSQSGLNSIQFFSCSSYACFLLIFFLIQIDCHLLFEFLFNFFCSYFW